MSDRLVVGLFSAGVLGLAVVILFIRDHLRKGVGRRYIEPTAQIAIVVGRFLRPAAYLTGVVIFAGLIFVMVSENRGSMACWLDNETGTLSRTCALHKIAAQPGYGDIEILEITGIADVSENVERVEFKWRPKPAAVGADRRSVDGSVTFRKYDDGWRPEGASWP